MRVAGAIVESDIGDRSVNHIVDKLPGLLPQFVWAVTQNACNEPQWDLV